MKIAMISSGSSIHVKKIANELVERGHEITLYTLPNNDKLLDSFNKKIKVDKLPIKGKMGYYLNAPYIKKQLAKAPVDIINAHYASGYGTLARMVGKHPVALAVFGSDVYDYPFRSKSNKRRIIRNLDFADVLTSTSNIMVDKVREFYPQDRDIVVTPFGIDPEVFYPRTTTKDDCFEIGIIKKIEKKYGIDYLIRAVKILKEQYKLTNIKLVIYGQGSETDHYISLATSLGLEHDIHFMGFIENEKVPEALSHMDVACFPSIEESFGVAAVEAMACGVPVVASNASGFTEVVDDGTTGILVPKKDKKALAEAIYTIYKMSPSERKKMGDAGIDRVKRLYLFKTNMDTYEKAIKSICKE